MDSSVSPKDEIWFLRVCHHVSTGLYLIFGRHFIVYTGYRRLITSIYCVMHQSFVRWVLLWLLRKTVNSDLTALWRRPPPHPIDKNRKKICLKIQISITKCNGERLVRGNGGEKVKSGGSSVESRRRQEERNTRKDKSERKEEECKKKNLLQGHRK